MKLEVACLEVLSSETGQNVLLAMDVPPPEPAVDGHGNPVAAPPPPTAKLRMFVTSDERRAALRKADSLKRKIKALRPELAPDEASAAERAKLTKELAQVMKTAEAGKELRFEHGARYVITVEKIK